MRPYQLSPATSPVPYHSAWHSPVPYLFGGLAAMLGLISLALLMLACSYWKLNSLLSHNEETQTNNSNDSKNNGSSVSPPVILHELFAVFMPGEEKPTFIATPSVSRNALFDCEKGGELEEENKKNVSETL